MTKKKNNKYFYGLGRRKTAVAQVRLYRNGQGKITINGKTAENQKEFFIQPLSLTKLAGSFDISVKVKGGGIKSRLDATRLGIARALLEFNPQFRKELKDNGYLTRDPRVKERKKPGLKRARRAPQWAKR